MQPAALSSNGRQETVARSGRQLGSNTKPAGSARPDVVAPRSRGPWWTAGRSFSRSPSRLWR